MPAAKQRSYTVCGVRVDEVDLERVLVELDDWIARGRRSYVVLTNTHSIVEVKSDPTLRRVYDEAGLATADGKPIVWMGRLKRHPHVRKVSSGLMPALMEHGVERRYRHFLYGSTPETLARLREQLEARIPGLQIVGAYSPPFRPLDEAEGEQVVREINAAAPHVVWVGLGCPRQERWMAEFRPRLDAPVLVGVGAAFDFFSGNKPVVPGWIDAAGFEWLFRLASEPRRLLPRYARVIPRFVLYAAADLVRSVGRRAPSRERS